jgi:hypothetical protein
MDVIHKEPRGSIYFRTDYLVNSDMAIPFGLARGLEESFQSEGPRRHGFPQQDRGPQFTPIVLHPNRIPRGK